MRILVTGGLGFVGKHLCSVLHNHEVHVFDRERASAENYHRGDLLDYYSLEQCFDAVKPEIVIHLAGMVSRKECEETPNLAIATNVGGTQSICTLTLKHEARLIYSGSSEEYGIAFKNGAVDESTPFGEPTSIYSMTKRMAEELIQYHSYFKGLTATTVRLFMLYGVGEEPSDYRSAVVRFIDWALRGQSLTVHRGTERSWCYIDDVVEAIELIVEREQENHYEVFNLGKDDPISAEDLANKILEVCNSSSNIFITDPEQTVIPIKRASFEKAKQVLGWEAKIPLEEGLKKVASYIRGL